MSIQKRSSWLRLQSKPVGDTLESGDGSLKSRRRRHYVLKATIIAAVVLTTVAIFPRGEVYRYTVNVDDIWRQDNLHAPFRYAIRKQPGALDREKAQVQVETPPYFNLDDDAVRRLHARRDTLQEQLNEVLRAYGDFQSNRLRGRDQEAVQDSIRYRDLLDVAEFNFSAAEWDLILARYTQSVPGLMSPSRSVQPVTRLDEQLIREVTTRLEQMYTVGVLDVPKDSVRSAQITVRSIARRIQDEKDLSDVYGWNEAFRTVQQNLHQNYPDNPVLQGLAATLFSRLFRPNLIYDRIATIERWNEREAQIVPSEDIVRENEVIIRRGDVVTEDIQRKLLSLESELNERSAGLLPWKPVVGQFLLTFGTYLIFFLYLYLLRRPIFDDNRLVFLISLLFLGVVGMYGVALRAALVDMYVIPVAVISILLTVIFDSRVGLFGTLTMALIGGHLLNYDFSFMFATVFAGSMGVFSVRDIRNRGQFFISAGVVFAGYVVVMCANLLMDTVTIERFADVMVFGGINAILMLLAYPLLWVFERSFDITTDLTLLELSDTNRPLLKELSIRASGTFNHVLQVANIAEAAATAIGANALLARVGTLYHDLGKMVKPEYFVENQRGGQNPHDGLKPRMSALIIASHVKEGLDIAREHRLPREVMDFIPMHHGTTRIEYFYRRALDQRKEGDPEPLESEFRYPGPKPNTKETSILMLADSVEAASRTLDNPTHKRLENMIDSIVDARREDGQLDEADLTFSELNTIKDTFLNVLMGIYHVRVKYPGDEESEVQEDGEEAGAGKQAARTRATGPDGNGASTDNDNPDSEKNGSDEPSAVRDVRE